MFPDEHREESRVDAARRQLAMDDPEQFYEHYVELLKRETHRQDRGRQGATSPSGSGKADLESLRTENQALRKKLNDVRNSRTMRLGRFIAKPYVVARTAVKSLPEGGDLTIGSLRDRVAQGRRAAKANGVRRGMRNTEATPKAEATGESRGNGGRHPKADGLFKSFDSDPTAENFFNLINHLWYNEFEIVAPAELIRSHAHLIQEADERTAATVRRIQGAETLNQGGVFIPERSSGAAYLAEPGRLMYCVHSTPVFNSNGYSTRTRGVAKGIQESGKDVVVVARAGYPWDSSVDSQKPAAERFASTLDGVEYVHTPGPNLNRDNMAFYIEQAADSFVREAKMLRPSVIMAASNHRTALPALIAARRLGIPFVYEVRGLWEVTEASSVPAFQDSERYFAQEELEKLVTSEADAVLAITEEVAEVLVERGLPRDKISLAPNAVNIEDFMPLPADAAFAEGLGIDPALPTVGFAGSLVKYEGLDVLLDASKLLQEGGVEHQIVVAGSGAAEDSLKEQAVSLGLDNVHFLGRLPQADMVRLMSLFDIVACPRVSTPITELVSPLKPLESYATASATVLSSVSPNLALAGAGEDRMRARLVEPGDPESLARALQELINDDDARRELARSGRLWVVKNRQWKMIGKSFINHLKRAEAWHSENASAEAPQLKDLKVAVIADEFTIATWTSVFDAVVLSRSNWKTEIQAAQYDLLLVESAWEGNGGQWHRGVGYYSEGEIADLRGLVEYCRSNGIPTVFWNKEDPVHFNRFIQTSEMFDYVFTTDSNMIKEYRGENGPKNKVVASQAFYAHPALHNPLLGTRSFHTTVAHAGTYYGDRYKTRSKQLLALLEASEQYGLDIFDRQADNPDSPYKFPPAYRKYVQGALPYAEVIDTYKSHFVHLNVNSVEDSPTMFSRRVVEIPASGGVVLSGPGRGVKESLGSNIPVAQNQTEARVLMHDWAKNPNHWLDERWRQMRMVLRSHTSLTELTILVRAIGLPVGMPARPTYLLEVETLTSETLRDILSYSWLPTVIEAAGIDIEQGDQAKLQENDIQVQTSAAGEDASATDWTAHYRSGLPRTFYEDLLHISGFGEWASLRAAASDDYRHEDALVETTDFGGTPDLVRNRTTEARHGHALIRMPVLSLGADAQAHSELPEPQPHATPKTVLIAGHDLKFLGSLVEELEEDDCTVLIDQWTGHNQHDEAESLALLGQADVVFCEWGLGNAVWYSNNVADHQRLVVRIHLQELTLPYLKRINQQSVDQFIMVGELVRRAAVESHGLPAERSKVIFNGVNAAELDQPKRAGASKTLGFVGMTPQRKRIDLALDVLELLLKHDPEYRLRIKGKVPADYPWMKDRVEELAWYEEQMARADDINSRFPGAVMFDGYGSDMPDWYRNIGIAISTSDFESFHFTIADGAASGAMPIALNWDGADLIYPLDWLVSSIDEMARKIIKHSGNEQLRLEAKQYVNETFEQADVFSNIAEVVVGGE